MSKSESKIFRGLANFLMNGITSEGGWDSEPGAEKETNPLNTAEVLCGLIAARSHLYLFGLPRNFDATLLRAISYLKRTQLQSGGWATGSAYRTNLANNPVGNTVSTCFSIWALMLHHDLVEKDNDLVEIVQRAQAFFSRCYNQKDYMYTYSPDLTSGSTVSTAYVLLSYSLIMSCESIYKALPNINQLETQNTVINLLDTIVDEVFIQASTNQYISAILIFLAIIFLKTSKLIRIKVLSGAEKIYSNIIRGLSLEQCTEIFREEQVVRENGKTPRDFIHYVPVWILMIYSQCDSVDISKYSFQVLDAVFRNFAKEYQGVYLAGKRYTWATGLTLFSLSTYTSNLDLDNIIMKEGVSSMSDGRSVFVVHGRDAAFRREIFDFLRKVSLVPLEWSKVVAATGKATPTTLEIIQKGFEISQAVLVLFTGDDIGQLSSEFIQAMDDQTERELTPQPRLNVVLEAGLALGINAQRSIIVRKEQILRKISDISGLNYVIYNGTPTAKNELVGRLRIAGCQVDTAGSDWLV